MRVLEFIEKCTLVCLVAALSVSCAPKVDPTTAKYLESYEMGGLVWVEPASTDGHQRVVLRGIRLSPDWTFGALTYAGGQAPVGLWVRHHTPTPSSLATCDRMQWSADGQVVMNEPAKYVHDGRLEELQTALSPTDFARLHRGEAAAVSFCGVRLRLTSDQLQLLRHFAEIAGLPDP